MTTGQGGRFEVGPTIGRAANVCGWGAMAVVMAGVGVFGIATGLEHWWGALLSWAAAAITAVAAVRVHHCRIAADEHGITVVNPLVSYHIDWPDLLGIGTEATDNEVGTTYWHQLRLNTTSGFVAPSIPAGGLKKGCPVHRTAITLAEMRELYAGPFPDPQKDPREARWDERA